MALPFFYIESIGSNTKEIVLNEDTSKHVINVLRMQAGEQLQLTDGKGNLITAVIKDAHKKHCSVTVTNSQLTTRNSRHITIAISLIKNTGRFEWFLEKAAEIGISKIIPLLCERTEKQNFRYERMKGILISAMLQSQQVWLPELNEPTKFENLGMWKCETGVNLIAHCMDGEKQKLSHSHIFTSPHSLICIGPEGDFTKGEIELAMQNNFIPVTLGNTRLRTETAGIVAATLLTLSA
jgi:16S rRNA (uracil1498-N3)-methyltransferase